MAWAGLRRDKINCRRDEKVKTRKLMAFFCNEKHSLHYLYEAVANLCCSYMDSVAAVRPGPFKWPLSKSGFASLSRSARQRAQPAAAQMNTPSPDSPMRFGRLLDHLAVSAQTNIVGFSLGGAVALEMATLRPACVPRLGLINSLATYRPDDWRKWLETYVSAMLVRLLGMRRAAWLLAPRLFPEPWQRVIRSTPLPSWERSPPVLSGHRGWRWRAGPSSTGWTASRAGS